MKIFLAAALLLAVFTALGGCAAPAAEAPKSNMTIIHAPAVPGNSPDTEGRLDEGSKGDEKPGVKVIKFLAAGDNIIHASVYNDAYARSGEGTPRYNFLPMYDGIADFIAAADVTYINQEGPMAGQQYGYSGYPNFNAPQDAGDTLVELGFDIVNIANNHMLDKWESGHRKTIDYWKAKDVLLLGAYMDKDDYDDIRVYKDKDSGLKIAFLSYTYGTNGMTLDNGSELIIPWIKDADITRQMKLAKEAGDLVFVSIHWGTDGSFKTTSEQERVARLLSDSGADVIIGTHPHVLQGVEWLERPDGGKTLLTYSLGNLISTMEYSQFMVGGILTLDIVFDSESGKISIENPLVTPTMCHYNMKRAGLQLYLLSDYTPELAAAHGAQLNAKFTYDTLVGYVTKNIKAEFLPDEYK